MGFLETWLGLKIPSAIHLSSSTSNSFRVHGIGRGVSYSLPWVFLLRSPVDTAIACRALLLSVLGFIDWAVFLAFCNNYANWEISVFSFLSFFFLSLFSVFPLIFPFSSFFLVTPCFYFLIFKFSILSSSSPSLLLLYTARASFYNAYRDWILLF